MREDRIVGEHVLVHERKLFLQLLWKETNNQNYYTKVNSQEVRLEHVQCTIYIVHACELFFHSMRKLMTN